MVIELRVVQFWSEIILVISNQTRAARSFDFEITRIISDQIALHSVQLPILIKSTLFNEGDGQTCDPQIPDLVGIWKCWFLRGGGNRNTWRKASLSKDENQQR